MHGLIAERRLKVDCRNMQAFVQAADLNLKQTSRAGEHERPDLARKREPGDLHQDRIDISRLVFIDCEPANAFGSREQANGAKTNMASRRGWLARGQCRIGCGPLGR